MKWLGRLLRGFRAGEAHLAWNDTAADAPASMSLASPSFEHGGAIPQRHAGPGVGDNISPELAWSGVPAAAMELLLFVEDPDAPLPRPFVHAVVAGIDPTTSSFAEGRLSVADEPAGGLVFGKGTFGKRMYSGPRPVPGHGPHRYVFQIFALDRRLELKEAPSRSDVLRAIRGAVIARGRLDGIYER